MKTLQKDLTTGNPGKIIFNFANLENLRIFQICLFTGGAITGNGILLLSACSCRAADNA